MVAVVAADVADRAVATLTGRGVPAWVAGSVERSSAPTHLVGSYL
jgi:phosphoribosylformylglycinamidine cyclo-ligase